ncbi:DUF2510 domain-containing protein [Amycolatopsis sp. NPDC052450]|uniref:DUF2510 domain-containing protein n=1 Tax=Amycolatopsis sp. NPDC052450 TaxID=3363937 RepID=UPI0037C92F98
MISTGGLVRGSSKKQRSAKAQLKELREQTELARAQAAAAGVEQAKPLSFGDQMRANWGLSPKQQVEPAQLPEAPAAPAPGWYPSPNQAGQMQWWDGAQWTPSYAPKQ